MKQEEEKAFVIKALTNISDIEVVNIEKSNRGYLVNGIIYYKGESKNIIKELNEANYLHLLKLGVSLSVNETYQR